MFGRDIAGMDVKKEMKQGIGYSEKKKIQEMVKD